MKKIRIISSLILISLFLAGCSSGGVDEVMNKKVIWDMELDTTDDYVLETNDFKATIKDEVLFINSDNDLGEPKLYFYEDSSEKNYINLTEVSANSRYNVHKGLGEDAIVGLELGDTDYGLFATPKMLSASVFPLSIPDDPATIRPTSGYWDLTLTGSSGDLSGTECPTEVAGFSSQGEVRMEVDPSGMSATMVLDAMNINFYRPNIDSTHYDSYDYSFSTPTSVGTVSFEFEAIDQENVTGQLNWDNNEGCSAIYNFTMELKTPTEFPPYVLKQGNWMLAYQAPIVCGTEIIDPVSVLIPVNLGSMDITGGGPSPMMPNFTFNTNNLRFIQDGYSNHYNSLMPLQFLGVYQGNPLTGGYDLWATGEERVMGILNLFGPSGCVAAVPFSLEFIN